MSNTFGSLFKVTTFGESHSPGVGCVIDGCPAGITIDPEEIQNFVNFRRANTSQYSTSRIENDECEILSGFENNVTLGSPICIFVRNKNIKKNDYDELSQIYRPNHADFTYEKKYGVSATSGGGRASARETVARVLAGSVAKKCFEHFSKETKILTFVQQIHDIHWNHKDEISYSQKEIYDSEFRCPDKVTNLKFQEKISVAKNNGDSLGGSIRCLIQNPPLGLGDPVFHKLEALLSQAMMSIPSVKYFESGTGIQSTYLLGSENNDPFYVDENGSVKTQTNHSGGIQGGISNGMPITFTVGFKPVSTIFKKQNTVNKVTKTTTEFQPTSGRHDVCVLPRAVPIVEAMAWIALLNCYLSQKTAFFHHDL